MSTTKPAPARGFLTVEQVCSELQISKSTFHDWRAKGRAPRCIQLPNRALRIRKTDFDKFLTDLEKTAR